MNWNNTLLFKKADWIGRTNVYEVNLRQYTPEGTFNAFIAHLPRLRKMGIQTLWFMPITPIAQMYKKGSLGSPYACSDYCSINPEFGNLQDFKDLVNLAHEMGFKVIIDWVANHTGWDHIWTKTNPDFYKKDTETGNFLVASGMDDIIELDYENNDMRSAMQEAMLFWINETNIDGFRCDLASWVPVDFWMEARTFLEPIKKLFWLAEADPIESKEYMQVFDAAYTWKWMHQTKDFYQQQLPISILTDLLFSYNDEMNPLSIPLWFTSNHDENSWNGTEYEKYGEAAKLFAVHSFTWNGIPLIYSGQELPNLKRLQFFDKDVIQWNNDFQMEDFYATLLSLKNTHPALAAADEAVSTFVHANTKPEQIFVYRRDAKEQSILVILNFSNAEAEFRITDMVGSANWMNIFTKDRVQIFNETNFTISKWGYQVLDKLQ